GSARRAVLEARRLGDALRPRVAELLLLGAGYQDDFRPLLDRIPGAPRREQAADEGGSEPDRDRHRAWTSVLEESQTVGTVPPSITYSLPWIEAARLDARKATSSATSSGRVGPSNALLGELGALEVGGGRHTSGRAHADDGAVTATPRELEQRGSEVSNARHAIRVAERHCTTVDARDLPRGLELRLVVERGHRVRLVELPH